MDYVALWLEIQANAECHEFIHTNEMPRISGEEALAKDTAIAEIISRDRSKIVRREIGDGALCLALGTPAGPVFLYRLRQLASTQLADDASDEQIAPIAVAQQALSSLAKSGFDVGDAAVRAGLDSFVGPLLSQEQADLIKGLAKVQDPVSAADISRAIRGPRE